MSNTYVPQSKDVKYIGRDFDSIKKGLIDFAKTYYPNTYNDFNEASPGMMFLEMTAYVGDTLNYYIDAQFKESLLLQASERRNVLAIAAAMGYKPKISVPSTVDVDVYQLMPSTGNGVDAKPDVRYALLLQPGTQAQSTTEENPIDNITPPAPVDFYISKAVDFSIDTPADPVEFTIYSLDANANPNYYLAKKKASAVSAVPVTQTVEVANVEKFFKFIIPFKAQQKGYIGIQSIIDADGFEWTEVPYLAQDTVFEQVVNTEENDPDASVYSSEIPYLLKIKKVPRRFVTRILDDGVEVQFGAGISTSSDEELLATPENIGISLPTGKTDIDQSIDPNTPGITKAYGIAPSNTTLTVTYLVGGGTAANINSNTITKFTGVDTNTTSFPLSTPSLNSTVYNSLAINNPKAASGGRSQEDINEIRQNALKSLFSQNRAVNRQDYIIRALAMPPEYGSVNKVFITPDEQNNIATSQNPNDTVANPLALNMYLLGYDKSKNLTKVSKAVKENLKTYISQYRMLTDSINLRDAYTVNIQVNFDVIALPNKNANEVLLNCVERVKGFFNIDRWQINQPIILGDIFTLLLTTPGIQTVTNVSINNLNNADLGYSNIFYGIKQATRNGIIYPSLDPMIFEVKYPDNDIKGRIASY